MCCYCLMMFIFKLFLNVVKECRFGYIGLNCFLICFYFIYGDNIVSSIVVVVRLSVIFFGLL